MSARQSSINIVATCTWIFELKELEGTCTLAIVMLNFFSDGELPGGVEGPFASRDVTSFSEIWQAAQQIEVSCVIHKRSPGWAAEGMLTFRTVVNSGKEQ